MLSANCRFLLQFTTRVSAGVDAESDSGRACISLHEERGNRVIDAAVVDGQLVLGTEEVLGGRQKPQTACTGSRGSARCVGSMSPLPGGKGRVGAAAAAEAAATAAVIGLSGAGATATLAFAGGGAVAAGGAGMAGGVGRRWRTYLRMMRVGRVPLGDTLRCAVYNQSSCRLRWP